MSERQNIDPEELAMLDEEQAFLNSTTKNIRRVRVDKNESLTVRFLPMEFGPKKWFYQRIAFHWIGKRPYYCEKHTAAECGGNPEATCPLCDFTVKLNDSRDRNVANAGFRAMANPQYILYCLVFERDRDGDIEKVRGAERWKAWEFPMPKVSFATFLQLYRRSLSRQPDRGILSLVDGNDIIVSLPGRDYAFQREDSQPIFDPTDPDKFQDVVNKIWSSIQLPVLRVPTDEDCDKAIEKIEESIGGRSGRRSTRDDDRGRGRRRDFEDEDRGRRRRTDDDIDDSPRRTDDDADAPRGRKAADDEEYSDRGPRRRDESAADDRRPTPPSVAASARSATAAPSAPRVTPPPPAARAAAASSSPPSMSPPPPPPQARSRPPGAAEAPARTSGVPAQSSIDDDDNVTDEARDPAPTATPEDAGSAVTDEAPPAVAASAEATAATTPPKIKDRLTRGIQAAKERL
jgi:hypothetical protein